jgi:predicted nucleic acid-binding protein
VIENQSNLLITDLVIAEIGFALRTFYSATREDIIDALIRLLRRTNIQVHNLAKEVVIDALLLCRPSNRVSIPDALIWAVASSEADGLVYTFDGRFPADGAEIRRLR